MVVVEIEPLQRLLVIRYRGRIGPGEAERGFDDVNSGIVNLQSGFRVLVDLSELESMEIGAAPFVEKIMDLCNAKGVAKVIRVIPDPRRDIGLQIMSYFHYGKVVQIVTCQSAAEADEMLGQD